MFLFYIDDEESEDEDGNSVKSFDDGADEDKLVDYDSEENEVNNFFVDRIFLQFSVEFQSFNKLFFVNCLLISLVTKHLECFQIVLQPDVPLPKKQKGKHKSEFFDQEAELTSEDEWKASGDEDERGLDQMEREEGDDDQFDQRAMKKQLDRIHL